MQHKLIVLAVVAACVLLAALSVMASEFKTLDFLGSKKGTSPYSNLIFDTAGNLYGTTLRGGANNLGTIFELVPNANGGWAETVLYSFCSLAGCADGRFPSGGLIFDSSGNLYGITSNGGTNYDDGTAFELVAGANGTWTLKVLYSFCSVSECADGARPAGDLIFDTAGNLYGTTSGDGPGGVALYFS